MLSERTPTVFVSSTCYDLKQVREDIKEFFQHNYGFEVMLSEFNSFPIDPCKGTFENCLKNVDECADFFILIVGTRYGYITDQGKSITNLEYLHAKAKGIPIYVFVSKQLYDCLPLWRKNKDGDYSSVVDNSKIFEFVSEIYDEAHQWVYTYDSVRDITVTLKNQLLLTFVDGLKYKKLIGKPKYSLLESDISNDALRVLIEKPYAWECKFFAYVIKDEFSKLNRSRWNYKYGFFEEHPISFEPSAFISGVSEKFNEMIKLTEYLGTLLNTVVQDAVGELGTPSDLELLIYVSKQLASLYERVINWGLYFKSLHVDEQYTQLLHLLYQFPKPTLDSIDDFVDRLFNEITSIPDVDDGIKREINLTCTLSTANTDEITEEINRLIEVMKS